MLKVFISHAWEDNEFARRLATQLRNDGVEVWIYFAQLKDRDYPVEMFGSAIEDCDIFLLVWSYHAAAARNVFAEWRMASELKKTILSCLLDDTRQSDPFRSFFFVRFSDFDNGYATLKTLLNLNDQPLPSAIEAISSQTNDIPNPNRVKLRDQAQQLSEAQVTNLIKKSDFFDIKRNISGRGASGQLELLEISSDAMVFDPRSNLLWQQSGSQESMWFEQTQEWLMSLNQRGYGGYHDWRLPTLEEAMSLMRNNNDATSLYIDPIFDPKQLSIWTADTSEKQARAWVVFFNYGCCHLNYYDFNHFVRAVRSHGKR